VAYLLFRVPNKRHKWFSAKDIGLIVEGILQNTQGEVSVERGQVTETLRQLSNTNQTMMTTSSAQRIGVALHRFQCRRRKGLRHHGFWELAEYSKKNINLSINYKL
jgi:hypothetical protein